MSEYQHYEFLAIDRQLSVKEMKVLREYSSRAEISPSRFSVVYNWGDFKGSVNDFMTKYFDAHVYVSNFGVNTFMLRLPGETISQEEIEKYVGPGFEAQMVKGNWLLTWNLEDEPDDEWMEDEGWMARLVPIREEIERGDYRALYIGWLWGVQYLEEDDDAGDAPPVPPGLASLTPAQNDLVEFLNVDVDILEAAAQASQKPEKARETTDLMADWVAGLSGGEASRYLLLLLQGKGKDAERQIHQAFNEAVRSASPVAAAPVIRTAGELVKQAETVLEQRLKREEAERRRQAEKRRQEREKSLLELAGDFDEQWKLVESSAARGTASGYDEAMARLVDMAEAAALVKKNGEFSARLTLFRETYARRPALIRRLDDKKLR